MARIHLRAGLAAVLTTLVTSACAETPAPAEETRDLPPLLELSTAADHERTMRLLGIEKIRPGRNGLDPQHPNYANYDETTSNPYPDLPPLLTAENGDTISSRDSWETIRRPELIEVFNHEIYGRAPGMTPKVRWEVTSETEDMAGDVPVVIRELTGHVDNSGYPAISVDIAMTLTVPATAERAVPAIMSFVFRPPPGWTPPEGWSPPPGPTATERIVSRGWAHAELVPATVQADNGAGLTQGIIGLVNQGQPRALDDWGALRAWAWGASRALDYLELADDVDASRVAIEGLSRYGKATLVTMAYEPRFAVGFAGSAGAAGGSLYRRDNGEIVENVAGSGEYHWMAGNFIKYAGPLGWNDMPIDAHSLIALSAPRPLFVGTGTAQEGDAWVDPVGTFMAVKAASPVYELYGEPPIGTETFPGVGVGLADGALAFRQHEGGHTNGPNWESFLDFAEQYLCHAKN